MTDAPSSSWLRRARKGLFTHEDKFNLHKMLGLPCLAHFLFRTGSVPFRPLGDMQFQPTKFTALLILWHLGLSLTSLVFKLPKTRIKEGSRIWPEFRLHSIVFACRSLSCMLVVWAEERYQTGPYYLANVGVIFATLLAADMSTAAVDPRSRSNTIRGLEMSAVYKYSFSLLQFLGTSGCLVGLRAYAAQFAIVFIIQTYAFTLTLRRKNLISHNATVSIYATQLTLGVTVANMEVINAGGIDALFMFVALALGAASLRMFAGLNKYLVWAIMSVIVQHARRATVIVPPAERYGSWPWWGWAATALGMVGVFLGNVVLKESRKAAAKAVEAAAAKGGDAGAEAAAVTATKEE